MKPTKAEADAASDAALDAVALKQLTWKPNIIRNVGIAITRHYLDDRIAWADEVELEEITKNNSACIGTAWRMLAKAKIIERVPQTRRSTKANSKGRTVFKYRLLSEKRARTFLARNGYTALTPGQPELPVFGVEKNLQETSCTAPAP